MKYNAISKDAFFGDDESRESGRTMYNEGRELGKKLADMIKEQFSEVVVGDVDALGYVILDIPDNIDPIDIELKCNCSIGK